MRTSTWRRAAALCAVLALSPLGTAQAQRPPDVTVSRSLRALSEITRNPKTGMPRLVMRNAQGIAIIPDMFKASFVFGARFGRGVLLIKQPDGTWSNPLFIHLMGGSVGAQAGAQSTDLILVFQTQRGLDRFIKGRGKLTLGVDVGAAAGPVGKRFEAGTDVALKSEILSYSNTRGIFAGVSAEGGTLQIDWRANMNYYGQPASAGEVLAFNSSLPIPAQALNLKQMLAEKTALPAGVIVQDRPSGPIILEEGDPVIEGEEVIIEDDGPAPKVSRSVRSQPATRKPSTTQPKPRVVRPDDLDDLDPLPRAKPAPRTSNDEDLPTAVPDVRPTTPKPKTETKPRPPAIEDEEIPPLEPPKA